MTVPDTAPLALSEAQIDRMRRHVSEGTPHAAAIGMQLQRAIPAETWLSMPYQDMFVGNAATGAMHGGVITALLDHACGAAVQVKRLLKQSIATLDLRIDYMKPAANGVTVTAHAHCYKMTNNIAFVRATAYQDGPDDLVANAVATFMLAANRTPMSSQASERPPLPPATVVTAPLTNAATPSGHVLSRMPYAQFLGVEVEQTGAGAIAIMRYHPKLIGNPILPALHGGAIGAFLETAAMLQVAAEMGEAREPKPIGITVNYLRSGRPVDTYAVAKITKEGRRVASIAVEAWQDDRQKPIASAYGHFLLKAD